MLQNARVTAFTVSELVRENQEGCVGRGEGKDPPTEIRVEKWGSIAVLSSEFDVIFQISFSIAVQNAEIPPNFLVWKFCGSTQRVLGGSPEILQKLRFQTISTPGNLSENTVFYAMHRVLQSE